MTKPEWVKESFRKGRFQLTVGKSKYKEGSYIYSIQMGKKDPQSSTGWTSVYLRGITRPMIDDLKNVLDQFFEWDNNPK